MQIRGGIQASYGSETAAPLATAGGSLRQLRAPVRGVHCLQDQRSLRSPPRVRADPNILRQSDSTSAPPPSKELAETELWLLDLSRLPQTRVTGHKDLVEFLNLSDGSSWELLLLASLLVAEFLLLIELIGFLKAVRDSFPNSVL